MFNPKYGDTTGDSPADHEDFDIQFAASDENPPHPDDIAATEYQLSPTTEFHDASK